MSRTLYSQSLTLFKHNAPPNKRRTYSPSTQKSNINLADIIPPEMQEYFSDLRELATAKAYVKEVEEREKILQAENNTLKKDLDAARQAVEDLPDDHKQLQVDMKQAQSSIQFYKGLKEDAETTAESYRRKMMNALSKQTDSEQTAAELRSLEKECHDLRNSALKQVKENHDLIDLLDNVEAGHLKALNALQDDVQRAREHSLGLEAQLALMEDESDVFERTTGDVMGRMTEEADDVAEVVNAQTQYIRQVQACEAAAATEARFLARWIKSFHSVQVIYQNVFQKLCEAATDKKVYLPAHLEASIASAYHELEAFDTVAEAFDMEGLDNESVKETRMELAALARSAHNLQASLGVILKHIKNQSPIDRCRST